MAKLFDSFEKIYESARQNIWYYMFYLFCRWSLAFAFIAAGMVKIFGERFASGLPTLHPMGAYLEALHQTGYYYNFIGVAQVVAGLLLVIPRTVLLGAILYLPIIVNIWVLSFSLRFEGSYVTSPLMVLANMYILLWHYDKLQHLFPSRSESEPLKRPLSYSRRFPYKFFLLVVLTVLGTITFAFFGHEVMPRNSLKDCQKQFAGTEKEAKGDTFCSCIHEKGRPLKECLEAYDNAN